MGAPARSVGTRESVRRRLVAAGALLLFLLGGLVACADGASEPSADELVATPGTSSTPTPSPTGSEVADAGVDFRLNVGTYHSGTSEEGWYAPRFDLYVPVRPRGDVEAGLPVVVMFHGAPGVMEKASLHSVAEAVAARGAVVMVPNWGTNRYLESLDPQQARTTGFMTVDAAACAVAHAVTLAPGLGGDPQRLAVLGNSAGAMITAVVSLREPQPFPGCASEASFDVDVTVLWEGDWMLVTQLWDRFGEGLPVVMEAYTPWSWIGTGHSPVVVLVTTPGGRRLEHRCDEGRDGGWLTDRDPTGELTARLEAVGAFDDGCLDVAEPTWVLAARLREAGYEVVEPRIVSSGHTSLRVGDRERVIDALFEVWDGPPAGD